MNRLLLFIFASILIESILLSGTFGHDSGDEHSHGHDHENGHGHGHSRMICCNTTDQEDKRAQMEQFVQKCYKEVHKSSGSERSSRESGDKKGKRKMQKFNREQQMCFFRCIGKQFGIINSNSTFNKAKFRGHMMGTKPVGFADDVITKIAEYCSNLAKEMEERHQKEENKSECSPTAFIAMNCAMNGIANECPEEFRLKKEECMKIHDKPANHSYHKSN